EYMNAEEIIFWIEHIWNRRAPLSNSCSLLVLNSFLGHITTSVKNRLNEKNTNIAVIPDGLTKTLQPLDVYINKCFKEKNGSKEDVMFNYNWIKNPEARSKKDRTNNSDNRFNSLDQESESNEEDSYYDNKITEYVPIWD
ncbi:13709_t:CDS:2, partial [Cetraspora pellucida]